MEHASLSPPAPLQTLKEVFAPIEWFGTLIRANQLRKLPAGDGRPVMLAPGYMADEWTMLPLKRFLQSLNYQVFDWGLGRNRGKVDNDIDALAWQISQRREDNQLAEPFTLIGWSLGGVISREVARLYPHLVREIITMGTPITGGPKYTALGKRYASRENLDLEQFEQQVLSRNKLGFSQPVTSIFSKADGIVSWEASLDVYNRQARNIEVGGSHLGLGLNTRVWQLIACILAEKPEQKPNPG